MTTQILPPARHLLTIGLEDYYQVGAFDALIHPEQWYRFEDRLERSTRRTLDLLDEFGLRATFFVLGWTAEKLPDLVREVAERGHEIACRGYYHRGIRTMAPAEFREDVLRARDTLERAAGTRVLGYRVANGWFDRSDLWALDVLASEGFEYDSSLAPFGRQYAAEPWRRFVHSHHFGDRVLWEFPISTAQLLGQMIPVAGGNYLRQLPHWFVAGAIARWDRQFTAPLVFYFHTWELDPGQPRISAAPWLARLRHYRHLDRMEQLLRYYFARYRMTGVAEHLGLSTALARTPSVSDPAARKPAVPAPILVPEDRQRIPVTVVIPCYNEELVLPYLANTLARVQGVLGDRYELRFTFVDDRSTDTTWPALHQVFGDAANVTILRHERNQGVAAAIMTGLDHATTEIVCSMDCDCTYDPHLLGEMIPLLDEAELVTASPYHPQGAVRNVPEWRLLLSRQLSRLYRLVLGRKLHTWTSCFRVYRRSSAVGLRLTRSGFLGVAETMAILVLRGSRVVEYPATLDVRILGRSKMKIFRTVLGHLRLLAGLAVRRLAGRTGVVAAAPGVRPAPDRQETPAPYTDTLR